MALFSSSPEHPPQHEMTKRSGRKACWDSRDKFFACLDKNNIADSDKQRKETKSACGQLEQDFEHNCIESWVEYFKLKRIQTNDRDAKIKQLEAKGAIRMEVESGFKAQ